MLQIDDVPLIKMAAAIIIQISISLFPSTTHEISQGENLSWDNRYITYQLEMSWEDAGSQLLEVEYFGNGTCVPYVRERTGIKMYGSAKTFLDRAEDAGYTTSTEPLVGSIIVLSEGNGHVAVVEEIVGDEILISEQNYYGLYIVSNRLIDKNYEEILGYIY